MLAFIANYWFLTLPTVLTGLYLLRILKQAKEERAARAHAPATIARGDLQGK